MDTYSTVRNAMAEMWVIPNLNSLRLGNNSNEYVGAEGMLGLSSNQSLPGAWNCWKLCCGLSCSCGQGSKQPVSSSETGDQTSE